MNTPENTSALFDFDQVLSRKDTASMKWDKYRNQDILPFWVADMDFEVAPVIQQALQERLKHPVFGYTVAPDGLFEAVQKHLVAEYKWSIDPDWVVWIPGVVAGLAASCRAFCSDGGEILVNPPIYHHFYDSHLDDRQTLTKVPLHKVGGRWTYDFVAMEQAINANTKVFLMCTPHNPTGTVFTQEELQQAAALCKKHGVIMISDEIHCDLVIDAESEHVPTAMAVPDYTDHMVTLMSGSKTWNIAGLNCSFAIISDEGLREKFRAACQSIVPMVPPLAYEATRVAYADGGPWRQELLCYLAGNYEYLKQEFASIKGMSLEPIQATYLAWVDATELGLDDTQGFLEKHGVGLSSGEQFGQDQFVRINFACPRATLKEGVDRIRKAVESL